MTAAAMAGGVRKLLDADIGLSITGVAGPGEEEHKRAGLTYIGIANPHPRAVQYNWSGDRWFNRRQSVLAALRLLAPELEGVDVR
jgi:nicotinamide-nucleotide amidase